MTTTPSPTRSTYTPLLLLTAVILLGGFLRFYQLGAYSVGNSYYAATVQSMLTSWSNFFFVSFEPGGSVTVDKPPLGFWLQALSAYFLGVNGFALALPQALAGLLSIPLIYWLVKRPFGPAAGLTAAFILATTPVTISTERNNTIDGTLLFSLLLATWLFIEAVNRRQLRWLLLGGFMVGVGFNIKMMQAFLPLPALYAFYFLGSQEGWLKRVWQLGLTTAVIVVVSLWWPVVVDLIPADQRPFIGSTQNNRVLELIFDHNGSKRLFSPGLFGGGGGDGGRPGGPPPGGPGGNNALPANLQPPGPGQDGPPPGRPGGGGGPGGGPQTGETGEPGFLRLLQLPLAIEAGWLLPLALLAIPTTAFALGWSWPLTDKQLALLLWGLWLITEVMFFNFAGLFHAYYLIMLGPPLAALCGLLVWVWGEWLTTRPGLAWGTLVLFGMLTIAYQLYLVWAQQWYVALTAGITLALLLLSWGVTAWKPRLGLALVVIALAFVPLVWSGATSLNSQSNVMLPRSGPAGGPGAGPGQAQPGSGEMGLTPDQQTILNYVQSQRTGEKWFLATGDARTAAPYILETLEPVLTFGGFSGGDPVVDSAKLEALVTAGQLRFVLVDGRLFQQKQDVGQWLKTHCTLVTLPGAPAGDWPALPENSAPPSGPPQPPAGGGPGRAESPAQLADCQA